jgi:hypothetical protein
VLTDEHPFDLPSMQVWRKSLIIIAKLAREITRCCMGGLT